MSKGDELMNCIGLHGLEYEKIKWREWFEYVVELLSSMGLQPTKMQLNGKLPKGAPYGNSTHVMSFKGGKKKLEEYEFKDVNNVALICLDKGEKWVSKFIASVSMYPHPEDSIESKITLCIDEKFLPENREKLKDITSSLQKLCGAKYGYYYQRHLKNAPDCYVGGGTGSINQEDYRQLKKWTDAFFIRWQDGIKLAPSTALATCAISIASTFYQKNI